MLCGNYEHSNINYNTNIYNHYHLKFIMTIYYKTCHNNCNKNIKQNSQLTIYLNNYIEVFTLHD